MDYVLSAYVGVRSGNGSSSHNWALQLLAEGVLLAETTGVINVGDQGVLRKATVNYSSQMATMAGKALEVRLVLSGSGFNPQLAFDLVTLSKNASK